MYSRVYSFTPSGLSYLCMYHFDEFVSNLWDVGNNFIQILIEFSVNRHLVRKKNQKKTLI